MNEVAFKDLPENWELTTFGEVAELIRGVSYKKADASTEPEHGKVPVLRANNIGYGLNFEKLVYVPAELVKKEQFIKKGDIIIAMSSGSKHLVGKAAQANEDYSGGYGAFCANLRALEGINSKYIAYFYSSPENLKRISAASSGSNINNLKREHILEAPIPIAPLEQQKRIVAKIEELFSHIDAGIEALNKAKQLLKQYRQSVLKAAVTGELTKEWREQNKDKLEPASQLLERILTERRQKWEEQQLEQFKAKGKMPKDDRWKEKYLEPSEYELDHQYFGWMKCRLDLLTDAQGGYAFKSKDFSEQGHQIVKMANIKMEVLDLNNRPSFMEKVTDELITKYKILNNDILITLTGTREKRDYGYVVHIKNNEKSLLLNQRIARLRAYFPDTAKFLSILLQSEPFRNDFFSYETGNVGQGNVGMRAVTEVNVCLPSLSEQKEIVAQYEEKIQAANRLDQELDLHLLKAEKNKQSILASAFSGGMCE